MPGGPPTPPRRLTAPPPPAWWGALFGAGALLALSLVLPHPSEDVVSVVGYLVAAAVGTAGLRHNDPPHRRAWLAIVVGLWVGGAGQVAWGIASVGHGAPPTGPGPVAAGMLDCLAYAALLGGFLALSTAGRRTLLRRARLVDTAIVAFAVGFVALQLVVDWRLRGTDADAEPLAVGGLVYLVLTVAVGFAAAPVVTSRRGRPAALLLGGAIVVLAATNALFVTDHASTALDLPWPTTAGVAALLGGAALLHPSMRRIATTPPQGDRPLDARPLLLGGLALLLPPIIVVVAGAAGGSSTPAPGSVGSALDLVVFLVGMGALLAVRTHLLVQEGRRSDERFRQYFSLPLIGMVMTGPDGRTLDVNTRLCQMLGQERDHVLDVGLDSLVHPDERGPQRRLLRQVLDGSVDGHSGERRYVRADGSTMYARCSDHVVTDEDGVPLYVLGLVEDITQEHLADQRMAEHLALQDVVLRVAERFVNIEAHAVGAALDEAIADLGRQCDAALAFVLEGRGTEVVTTHAWRADGEPPRHAFVASLEEGTPATELLTSGRALVVNSVDDLPPGWEVVADRMRVWGAGSMVMLPLVADETVLGCIGLTRERPDRSWSNDTVDLLRLAAEVVTQALVGERTAAALAESEARNRSVVEAAADGIVTIDHRGRVRTFNPAAEQLTGWTAAEITGRRATDLIGGDGRAAVAERLAEGVDGIPDHAEKLELEGLRRDGSRVPLELTISPVQLPDGPGYTVIARDVSDRKRLEAQLTHQALHDPLTGLANRTLLLDRIGSSLRRAGRTGSYPVVLFIDLDRFKVINDSLGHDAGDELLMVIAHRLEAELRAGDTAARLGGDEFVVVCEGVDTPELAGALAERILESVCRPVELQRAQAVVTASIGIVQAGPGSTPETLLRDADASMYRAKDVGRNRAHHFDESVHGAALQRLQMEAGLRRAIADGELRLHVQGQYAVSDLRPVGAEVLLRWDRPGKGLVPPDDFLAVAEEIGLDVEIDRWVLREACRCAQRWAGENPSFVVWVNLSARFLADPMLPAVVFACLAGAGVSAGNLGIEITERALVRDLDVAAASLDELRAAGVRIAVDDFGTGFSSLSWLERLPLDALKIDRSFIAGLGTSRDDTVIVRSVVAMAHSLGLGALAEGVETEHQLAHLRELGCDHFQGFLAGRPAEWSTLDVLAPAATTPPPPGPPVVGAPVTGAPLPVI